jgi:hypothetical protein
MRTVRLVCKAIFGACPAYHQVATLTAIGPAILEAAAIALGFVSLAPIRTLKVMNMGPVIPPPVSSFLATAICLLIVGGLGLGLRLSLGLSCSYDRLRNRARCRRVRASYRSGRDSVGRVRDILGGVVWGNRTIDNPTLIPQWALACAPLCKADIAKFILAATS